jgi:hypothetical protein
MAQNVVINGVTYSSCPEVDIPKSGGGTAAFFDISDTTATAGDVLSTKYFHTADGTKTQGGIASKTSSDLSASTLTVTAPAGYYSSAASKTLSDQNLVSGNIKSGVTIFGVSGATNVVDTTVSSDAAAASTIISGKKAYVNGSLVTGEASMPTISQDSTTKVLSIS